MKKNIIAIIVLCFLALAGGIFYLYKIGFFNKEIQPALTPEELLVFEIKDPNLSPELAGDYKTKFDKLKEDLQKNPDFFNGWLNLAVLKKAVKDYEGARDIWLYCNSIRPNASTPYSSLGDLYANFLNEPDKAEQAFKKAIELDPGDFNFYILLAELYHNKIPGKEALFEQTLLDALARLPENTNIIAALASYYRQAKQTAKAIKYYEDLIRLDPDNQTAKEDLAELKNSQ